jgi:hypothetical protein
MLKNNSKFYDGYEDEAEIELYFSEDTEFNIHIWCGYIRDIYDEPIFNGNEWTGFTRDYQQEVRTYDSENTIIDVSEYLNDLLNYKDKHFRLEETHDCFHLLRSFLEYAKQNNVTVKVNWL